MSLRRLVAGTSVSTMAVYTYFDGMPGLLGAVRQEAFSRLAARLARIPATADPVADLAAAGGSYTVAAKEAPEFYAVMFDGALPLPDPRAADATLQSLIDAVERAIASGRFDKDLDAMTFANEIWLLGHGACTLFTTGGMTFEHVEPIAVAGLISLARGAGDRAEFAGPSVRRGWTRGLGH